VQEPLVEFELTKEFRDRFQEALDQRDEVFIRDTLHSVKAADITSLLYEFSADESKYVLDLLPIPLQAEIIRDLDAETRKEFMRVYESAEITGLVNHLDSDDAADILHELPVKQREEVLAGLEPVLKGQVTELLRYEENVAGGLMAKELMKARVHWTVVQCIDEIRKQAEYVSKFYTVYVVDENDVLVGRVALQDLIEDNVVEFTGVFTSESFIVHRLIGPAEYQASIRWQDRSPSADWYYVRATQHNGHLAWSSPIWVG